MSTVPAFLLLALLIEPIEPIEPTVAIEVGRDGEPRGAREAQLEALLTWRMLDDGLRVVGDLDVAQITLRVQLHADHSAAVVVRGASERVEHLRAGQAGTFELELLQVASIFVDELREQAEREGPGAARTVVLDLSEVLDDPAAIEFREALIPELLGRGWALSTSPSLEWPRVCIEDLDGTTLVSVARAGRSCSDPEASFGRFALGPGAQASAVDAAAALVDHGLAESTLAAEQARSTSAEAFADEALDALDPALPSASGVYGDPQAGFVRAPRFGLQARPELDLLVRGGALERAGVVAEPMARVAVRIGRMPGVAGRLGAAFVPMRGPGRSRALDSFFGAGFGWQHDFGRRGLVELGALTGAQIHSFRAGQPASPGTSTDRRRLTPWAELDLGLGWAITRVIGVHLQLRSGTSFGPGWVSFVDYRRFQRSGWYVAGGLGLSFTWSART